MSQTLLIVESPTKAKTIGKYLGPEYVVKASVGHVRDLPANELGIAIEGDHFEPCYVPLKGKGKIISELKKAARKADRILLAPDPDREGEAIAWHIAHELGESKPIQRVLFHEVTKSAILKALQEPLAIDINKVNAQQSRRILDRMVGYKISPLLWKTVRRGLSAGRVQSVAVRLVCDREAEIKAFTPVEYWSITTLLAGAVPPPFEARLHQIDGEKAEVGDQETADKIVADLQNAAFKISKIEQKERQRRPTPPFITSKLQQEAARKLGFSAKKTMMVAQQLYEGIELGTAGAVGLITYMRTDSVRVADSAVAECRDCILAQFGKEYLPEKLPVYQNKNASQDAHEAIRPTSVGYLPQDIESYLNRDQFRLYSLIWRRFVASQMNPARYYQTTVSIMAGERYQLRAVGRRQLFDGFLIVYEEGRDNNGEDKAEDTELPFLSEAEILNLDKILPRQHFTQPPPRFTESTLVKELEEKGIGRPSTYASIMSTIQERGYVEIQEKRFYPTDLGVLVTDLLKKTFPDILNVSFTALMEADLDRVEEGGRDWQALLADFYRPFSALLDTALLTMRDAKKAGEEVTDEICEKCGTNMVVKWGRNGRFLACPNYPECKNTRDLGSAGESGGDAELPGDAGRCPECGSPLQLRNGRYGRFVSCSTYPECKYTSSVGTGVACPQDGCDGELVEKKSRKGKLFYACNRYPQCTFAIWDKPYPMACPRCEHPFLVEKKSRGGADKVLRCPQKGCNYETKVPVVAGKKIDS
ncbi:MAG: type I DNA topoisomerase [Deltaproteobacteria bacterium]|nr:type I DNA topoisomerase [Deltaproteobacteria bacterium]